MNDDGRNDLVHNFVLPTLLFAALGGMTWAVRGCSGYGATAGCIFAGVAWGAAWWFISRDPRGEQSRRYTSGWIVLAVTVGLGVAGARGWMQWPNFFDGKLETNSQTKEFVPISRIYGFLWLFIAGVPWAGLGACMLAWCGSLRQTRVCLWTLRIACGIGGMMLGRYLFSHYPQYFLPLYDSMESRYNDLEANPGLKRLINDSGAAIAHMGIYLGFLLFELVRRDWKNVVLISTVGLLNGIGWAVCQNWRWAHQVWPNADFNFWRCWESSGGISIGIAYGVAYFLVNRPMAEPERTLINSQQMESRPAFESLLIFCGLATLFDVFLRFQLGGWDRYFFCAATVFAVASCLKSSSMRMSDPLTERADYQASWTIDWPSLLLGVAMLAGQFIPRDEPFVQQITRSIAAVFRAQEMNPQIAYYVAVIAVGAVYCLIRRRQWERQSSVALSPGIDLQLERFGMHLGVLVGLGLSIRNGLKGWFNIYRGNEDHWNGVLWQIFGPVYLAWLIAMAVYILITPPARNLRADLFPRAYATMWLVLIVLNGLAQLVTGPLSSWNEVAFSIYYVLLFAIQSVIVLHYRSLQGERAISI